jgi:hypothetical protein
VSAAQVPTRDLAQSHCSVIHLLPTVMFTSYSQRSPGVNARIYILLSPAGQNFLLGGKPMFICLAVTTAARDPYFVSTLANPL